MKVSLIRYDDWEALYINGELVAQDHTVSAENLLSLLKIDFEIKEAYNWWNENEPDGFPENLEDIEFDGEQVKKCNWCGAEITKEVCCADRGNYDF